MHLIPKLTYMIVKCTDICLVKGMMIRENISSLKWKGRKIQTVKGGDGKGMYSDPKMERKIVWIKEKPKRK